MDDLVVIDQSDDQKTEIEILMDLIYETNKIRIPQEHIVYGTPVALDQRPDDKRDENTYIPVVIDPLYDYNLSLHGGFLYRRQDIGEYLEDLNITITAVEFPFTIRSIWNSQIKPVLPFPIDASNVEDYLFTDSTQKNIKIKMLSKSLLFSGEVRVNLNPIDRTFFELVHIPYLTGFVEYTI